MKKVFLKSNFSGFCAVEISVRSLPDAFIILPSVGIDRTSSRKIHNLSSHAWYSIIKSICFELFFTF